MRIDRGRRAPVEDKKLSDIKLSEALEDRPLPDQCLSPGRQTKPALGISSGYSTSGTVGMSATGVSAMCF
jgi:hypothetical protein